MTYLLKSIEWRVIASFLTFIIIWLKTGNTNLAFEIGWIDFFIKTVAHAVWLRWRGIQL